MQTERAVVAGRVCDPQEVVRRLRMVIPANEVNVALHEPRFFGNEKKYVTDCVETCWVSYAGSYVTRFERSLAEICGVANAIAVTSGTVALHVALHGAGVRPGDEVLVPALTFVASANAVVHAGAIPNFVDVDETTLGVSASSLADYLKRSCERRDDGLFNLTTGRRIGALLVVHVFGHPADMDPLHCIVEDFGIALVEDAAEALGSRYKGKACGSLAPIAALSFNGNKVVTTGGGGAVLTDNSALAERIRSLTTTAKRPHQWAFVHDEVAWNFRLPNINAALGLAQLECLSTMLAAKRRLWRHYCDCFADLDGARVFVAAPWAESNNWLISLVLDKGLEHLLDPILQATNDAGVSTRPAWRPMHHLPMYADNPRAELPVAESLARRIISLPSSPFLAPE